MSMNKSLVDKVDATANFFLLFARFSHMAPGIKASIPIIEGREVISPICVLLAPRTPMAKSGIYPFTAFVDTVEAIPL